MGRKSVVPGFKLVDSQSLASNITSDVVSVKNLDQASIHLEWSGVFPVGAVTIEARNGEQDVWYELDFGSSIDISGASGNHQIVFNQMPFSDIRLQYSATSGSGTLDAFITAKVVGA